MTITTQQRAAQSQDPDVRDAAPVPVSGILDVRDDRAFIRTSGYRPGPGDVYVPLTQVRQHGLRRGDQIAGAARAAGEARAAGDTGATGAARPAGTAGAPRPSAEGQPARRSKAAGKSAALVRIDAVNGLAPELARARPEFDELTPVYPQERLRLDSGSASPTARIIDLVIPIGKGQRGLIVSAPKAGKTMVLQAIATAVVASH